MLNENQETKRRNNCSIYVCDDAALIHSNPSMMRPPLCPVSVNTRYSSDERGSDSPTGPTEGKHGPSCIHAAPTVVQRRWSHGSGGPEDSSAKRNLGSPWKAKNNGEKWEHNGERGGRQDGQTGGSIDTHTQYELPDDPCRIRSCLAINLKSPLSLHLVGLLRRSCTCSHSDGPS